MKSNKEKHPLRQPCLCKMKCWETFSIDDGQNIHEDYWDMARHLQRVWLSSKVTEELSKRKLRVGRRDITRKYFLPNKNPAGEISNTSVCQKLFLSTLGYSNANVLTSLRTTLTDPNGNKRLMARKDQHGRHPPPNKKDRDLLIAHIHSYNPLPSHYAREHAPNRKYLPPDLTIRFMHNDYKSIHPDFTVCYEVYRQIIDQLNLVFMKQLLKNVVSQIREMYRKHQTIPHAEATCFAADMQKVVLLPRMPDVKEPFFLSR
nr:unnamed protein product [Callosobruchus analis]